jgi:hypothetical protein
MHGILKLQRPTDGYNILFICFFDVVIFYKISILLSTNSYKILIDHKSTGKMY